MLKKIAVRKASCTRSLPIETASKAHKETQFPYDLACTGNSLIELKLFDRDELFIYWDLYLGK